MTISELQALTPDSVSRMSDKELIKAGKAAQRFVNQRLNRLEKAGLRTKMTSGGARKSSLKRISDRAKAERAILQARELEENPLSTPGKIHKQMKDAGLQKNPRTGKWTKKQGKDWLRQQEQTIGGDDYDNPEWDEGDIMTTFEEFWEWCKENHPEWSSKQARVLYDKAVNEYHVDPIKFWSAPYEYRKHFYDKTRSKNNEDSDPMDSDSLLDDDLFEDVDIDEDWEEYV